MELSAHCRRRGAVLPLIAAIALLVNTSCTKSVRTVESEREAPVGDAVAELEPGQRVRVRNHDMQILRGRFAGAVGDSIYVELSSDGNTSPGETVGMAYPDVNRIWKVERHGLDRGLLWASATFLGCVAYASAAHGDSLGGLLLMSAVTAAAVPTAFVLGYRSWKETLVYPRR